MEFVCQDTSESTSEKQVAAGSGCGCERTSDAVAFHISERDDRTIRDMSVSQHDGVGGQRRRPGLGLAGSVKSDDHDAWKRIRRGDLVEGPPVQFDSGIAHEVLEFPFHFVHGRLRMLGFELKDEGYRARRESGTA